MAINSAWVLENLLLLMAHPSIPSKCFVTPMRLKILKVHRTGLRQRLRDGVGSMASFIVLAFCALHLWYSVLVKNETLMIYGNVNVMGPWWLTRAAWSELCQSGEGRIQVLVSMSGKRVKGQMAGYPVSKFALMGLCQSMRNTGWDQGIRVTALCPSWVNTKMANGISRLSPEEMTQPCDLAALSSQLLALPNAAIPFEVAMNCALEI